MNFEKEGIPIIKIYKKGNEKGKEIYISPRSEDCKHPETNIPREEGQVMKLIPRHTQERDVLYIVGQSGSGKSYFLNEYLKEYKKIYKKRPIYLFSSLTKDKTLDGNKSIKRIKLDEKFLSTEFTLEDFNQTCLIFDDTDVITSKPLKKKLYGILDNLLQCGRHIETTIIFTSHVCCRGNDTKVILAEMTSLVFFPKTSGDRTLSYLLGNYAGMNKKEIEEIRKLKTRSVCMIRTYPSVILHDQGCYILHGDNF